MNKKKATKVIQALSPVHLHGFVIEIGYLFFKKYGYFAAVTFMVTK